MSPGIDIYTKGLPDGVCSTYRASQHFEAAEQIKTAIASAPKA